MLTVDKQNAHLEDSDTHKPHQNLVLVMSLFLTSIYTGLLEDILQSYSALLPVRGGFSPFDPYLFRLDYGGALC